MAAHELEQLLSFKHHDPHSIVGPHLLANKMIVHSYRPGAERMQLKINGKRSLSMIQRADTEGLFEVLVKTRRKLVSLPARVESTTGRRLTFTR
jgi:hypothetical protein